MRKKSCRFIVMISFILLLVACGSGEEATSEVDNEAPGADDSPQVETIEAGKLTFGSSGLYKPFNYEDLNGGETGFEVELGEALAKEMGLEPNPIFTQDFGALIEEVNADRIDVILGSLTITDERAEVVDFTNPYYISGPVFYVHKDTDDIKSFDDLDGKNVGVIADSVYEDTVLEHIEENQLATYQSDTVALQDLAAGTDRLHMVLTDKIVGLVQIDENNLDIKAVGDLIFTEEIGGAVRKGNEELLTELNNALEAIIEDGTFDELSDKWFGENILEQ